MARGLLDCPVKPGNDIAWLAIDVLERLDESSKSKPLVRILVINPNTSRP